MCKKSAKIRFFKNAILQIIPAGFSIFNEIEKNSRLPLRNEIPKMIFFLDLPLEIRSKFVFWAFHFQTGIFVAFALGNLTKIVFWKNFSEKFGNF